jgi:hypothetical protein
LAVTEVTTGARHLPRELAGKPPTAPAFLGRTETLVPVRPVTAATAEIIPRTGGEQAAKGPLRDLNIGACALVLGFAFGTSNVRDFNRISERPNVY